MTFCDAGFNLLIFILIQFFLPTHRSALIMKWVKFRNVSNKQNVFSCIGSVPFTEKSRKLSCPTASRLGPTRNKDRTIYKGNQMYCTFAKLLKSNNWFKWTREETKSGFESSSYANQRYTVVYKRIFVQWSKQMGKFDNSKNKKFCFDAKQKGLYCFRLFVNTKTNVEA